MQHISPEQKVSLIQQIHTRYYRDLTDLNTREQLLTPSTLEDSAEKTKNIFPLLRLLTALVLMLLIMLSEYRGASVFGMSTQQFFSLLDRDYYEIAEQWISLAGTENKENP